jgi:hypothetical protein
MCSKQIQHVVKKRDAGGDAALPGSVDIELDADGGFGCLPLQLCSSCIAHRGIADPFDWVSELAVAQFCICKVFQSQQDYGKAFRQPF